MRIVEFQVETDQSQMKQNPEIRKQSSYTCKQCSVMPFTEAGVRELRYPLQSWPLLRKHRRAQPRFSTLHLHSVTSRYAKVSFSFYNKINDLIFLNVLIQSPRIQFKIK